MGRVHGTHRKCWAQQDVPLPVWSSRLPKLEMLQASSQQLQLLRGETSQKALQQHLPSLRDRLSPSLVPLLTFSLKMDFLRSSTPSLLRTGSPSLSWRSPSTRERTPSGPLPWTVPKVLSAVMLSMTLVTPSLSLLVPRLLAASSMLLEIQLTRGAPFPPTSVRPSTLKPPLSRTRASSKRSWLLVSRLLTCLPPMLREVRLVSSAVPVSARLS